MTNFSDDDDYGDDFEDTEVFNIATQAENENSAAAFHLSPRPSKRRKVTRGNERTLPIPSHKQETAKRGPFVSSDCEDGSDASEDDNSNIDCAPPDRAPSSRRNQNARHHGLPNEDADDGEMDQAQSRANATMKTKKDRIHQPTTIREMNDVFCTQPPREDSPPWKTRGAIWAKPTTAIGVHRPFEPAKSADLNANNTISLQGKQFLPARPAAQASRPPERPVSLINGVGLPKLPSSNKTTAVEYDPVDELADLPSDAFESSPSSPQNDDVVVVSTTRKRLVAPQTGLRQTTLFGREEPNGQIPPSQVNKRYNFIVDQKAEPPTHHKLDPDAIKTWVYPTNLGTIRDYQFNIVAKGLFHNLLVALPTGLGKTFIAATIMLNWFRWTTEAQIVFVAPTKPLVSQQIEACFQIAGIPRSYTTMLTGGVSPALRSEEWANKRVFFMTPQTLLNDLKSGYADPKKIVLLVVDEAHRATGSYAYVEVVSLMRRFNPSFRVLALTATPGADVEAVQKVIDGLDISRVEIRTENSLDIREYVHQRKVEKHVFETSDEMEMCIELYCQMLQPLVNVVSGLNAFYSNNPRDLTPYGCTQARGKWFQEAGKSANQGLKGTVMAVFAILASVSHAMELLKYHGIVPFYIKLKDFRDSQVQSKSKFRKQVVDSDPFKKLMIKLQHWVANADFIGHPKLEYLQGVILDHFTNAVDGLNPAGAPPAQTRIMVFAHFRDSAEDIVRVLKKHEPMIRPRVFVGQSTAKNSEGMDQKEQLNVIEKFKMGTYNTLVATSIGEEGLDIGEVDLIICYDSKASPIRMLQRMGRTGRKRQGRIVMLQMKGKEENDAMKAKDNYEKMQELIAEGSSFQFHDDISRRILPPQVKPVVDRRVVEIPLENSQNDWLPEPKKRGRMKKPPKKFHMPDNVITGFVTAGCMDEEIRPKSRGPRTAKVYPSEEIADLPPLESVLLDEKATKDLERRYQTVFDDEDAPIIGDLDLSGHSQRALSQTELFTQHGRVTRTFVDTLQRIHAMDGDRLKALERNLHHSDCESDAANNIVVSDEESRPIIHDDMWADDDPASQTLQKPKSRTKPSSETATKGRPKVAPRSRPRNELTTTTTPTKQSKTKGRVLKITKHDWHASEVVEEAASSSPPPTDPRFRIASQAETVGSDDTSGEEEIQDTQAYRLDSDLVSFIAEDDEEIDVPESSLPGLTFESGGLGRGTQAIITGARPNRPPRAEKLFTSDPTDDDAVVSSDSDDEDARVNGRTSNKGLAFVADSSSEDEAEPVISRKRVRRVIDDDDDDDDE